MKNTNTKKLGKLGKKTLLVTVDIGKVKHAGYCRSRDGRELKPFEFSNTAEGFYMFWKRIAKIKSSWDLKDMVIGFESTGPYAEPLLHFLNKRGVRLVQVNPMHTKKIKELCDNSPAKTDWKDPRVIADIIELGHGLTVVIPEKETAD
jgi:transposase